MEIKDCTRKFQLLAYAVVVASPFWIFFIASAVSICGCHD